MARSLPVKPTDDGWCLEIGSRQLHVAAVPMLAEVTEDFLKTSLSLCEADGTLHVHWSPSATFTCRCRQGRC
jgi:hypothetical protein